MDYKSANRFGLLPYRVRILSIDWYQVTAHVWRFRYTLFCDYGKWHLVSGASGMFVHVSRHQCWSDASAEEFSSGLLSGCHKGERWYYSSIPAQRPCGQDRPKVGLLKVGPRTDDMQSICPYGHLYASIISPFSLWLERIVGILGTMMKMRRTVTPSVRTCWGFQWTIPVFVWPMLIAEDKENRELQYHEILVFIE